MANFDLVSSNKVKHLDLAKNNEAMKMNLAGGFIQPKGTQAQRPVESLEVGMRRYNTDTNTEEYYNGTSWVTVADDSEVVKQLDGDSGSALPASNIITIEGGTNITTSGSSSTITITNDLSGDADLSSAIDTVAKNCGTTDNGGVYSTVDTFGFTVAEAGVYRVECIFWHDFATNSASAGASFRLSGSLGTSRIVVSGSSNGSGISISTYTPVSIPILASLTTGSKSVTLQESTTLSGGSITNNSIDDIQWYAYRIGA